MNKIKNYPLRKGYATKSYPRGRRFANYASKAYAERAARRAKRWLAAWAAAGRPDVQPPRHIVENTQR